MRNRKLKSSSSYRYKIASEPCEFEQIYGLNYLTFVEEITQHEFSPERILIDKFHENNTYFICLRDKQLAGMVSIADKRPFSMDIKFENIGETLDSYLPESFSKCEIRLLAVDKGHRKGRVLQGILTMLAQHCKRAGYDVAIISGTVRQLDFYKRLGFVEFGPIVGAPEARFQPMYLKLEPVEERMGRLFRSR